MSTWQPPAPARPPRDPARARLRQNVILAVCTVIVVAGFVGTIISVSTDDIDGLNYLPNALLGLPWNLVVAPIAWLLRVQDNVYVRAVVDLVAALVNVALLGRAMRRRVSD